MSSRKDSLKRLKRLEKATRGHDFERHYLMDDEEEQQTARSTLFWIVIAVVIAAVLATGILLWMHFGSVGEEHVTEEPQAAEDPTPAPTIPPIPTEEPVAEPSDPMAGIATFMQGPKAWKKKIDWSGVWGNRACDGRRFAGFGCGLCVMANFYSSLTPYQCSPVDMYNYAKEASFYEGASAFDWPPIQMTLGKLGFTTETGRKPRKYERFQKLIAQAEASMVVISSYEDDSYWKNTPGHYVTIFDYNEEDDTVFLGDSGDPKHNRSRIPLETVYNAIKTSNALHFLRILGYDETRDEWKHTTISGRWCKPSYWTK